MAGGGEGIAVDCEGGGPAVQLTFPFDLQQPHGLRPLRFMGRLLAATATAVGLVVFFLALIVATDGAGSGSAAWFAAVGAGTPGSRSTGFATSATDRIR